MDINLEQSRKIVYVPCRYHASKACFGLLPETRMDLVLAAACVEEDDFSKCCPARYEEVTLLPRSGS